MPSLSPYVGSESLLLPTGQSFHCPLRQMLLHYITSSSLLYLVISEGDRDSFSQQISSSKVVRNIAGVVRSFPNS